MNSLEPDCKVLLAVGLFSLQIYITPSSRNKMIPLGLGV